MGQACAGETAAAKFRKVKQTRWETAAAAGPGALSVAEEVGKPFDPRKKTRAVLKPGQLGCHVVQCPRCRKAMAGKIAQEVVDSLGNKCARVERDCEECGAEGLVSDGYYKCSECEVHLCVTCARTQLGMPVVKGCKENPIEILAGDILLAWPSDLPLNFAAHHAILCVGQLEHEEEIQRELADQISPGAEVWSCKTVESTGLSKGSETAWTISTSFFERDPQNGTSRLLGAQAADEGVVAEDAEVELFETPVHVKVLLHPVRKQWGGPGLDRKAWAQAWKEMAKDSKKWSKSTCVKALSATPHDIDPSAYVTPDQRAQLLEDLNESWQKKPICSSVPVKVWQRYFEIVGSSTDEAAKNIINYVPVYCNEVTPAKLTQSLTQRGWVLGDNFEA